jgi:hypothetical protein
MMVSSTDKVQALQEVVLHEIKQLNKPRLGIMEMEVDIRLPYTALPYATGFVTQDIGPILKSHRACKAMIYFPPKYSLDKAGRDLLYADISRAALAGGDRISLWGRGRAQKQVMHIRCQCSMLYRGKKIDKETGSLLICSAIRNSTFTNDKRNKRHGQKGRNVSHRTSIHRRLTKDDDRCPFSLSVFPDEGGYYM